MFGKYGNRSSDVMYRVVFLLENDVPYFQEAFYLGTKYVLIDETEILQTRVSENGVFVSRIFEHKNAAKTIIILPTVYSDISHSYESLLALEHLADHNPLKPILVLLEGYNDQTDHARLKQFYDIRRSQISTATHEYLSNPLPHLSGRDDLHPTTISPSLALFYTSSRVDLQGLVDTPKLEETASVGKSTDILSRTHQELDEINAQIAMLHAQYEEMSIRILIADLEKSIASAVEKMETRDARSISRINEFQLELAECIVATDFVERAKSGHDTDVRDVLGRIDRFCGADLLALYDAFTKGMTDASIAATTAVNLHDSDARDARGSGTFVDEGSDALEEFVAITISERFSALPDGSIGICELSADRIDRQILLCLKKADYNLVLYNRPFADESLSAERFFQNPDDHAALFENYSPQIDLEDLHIPTDFRRRLGSEPALIELVAGKLSTARSAYRDYSAASDQAAVHYFSIPGEGAILRLTTTRDGQPENRYYLIPGFDVEEQARTLVRVYETETIPDSDKGIIYKWGQITLASLGL